MITKRKLDVFIGHIYTYFYSCPSHCYSLYWVSLPVIWLGEEEVLISQSGWSGTVIYIWQKLYFDYSLDLSLSRSPYIERKFQKGGGGWPNQAIKNDKRKCQFCTCKANIEFFKIKTLSNCPPQKLVGFIWFGQREFQHVWAAKAQKMQSTICSSYLCSFEYWLLYGHYMNCVILWEFSIYWSIFVSWLFPWRLSSAYILVTNISVKPYCPCQSRMYSMWLFEEKLSIINNTDNTWLREYNNSA